MNKRFQILSSLILILIFNLPFIGYYVIYNLRGVQIKEQIESGLYSSKSEQNLTMFKLNREQTNKNLTWLSKREFKYSGIVYKVVKVKYVGDEIIYYCHTNQEAAKVFNNLDKLINSAMGHSADTQSAQDLLTFMKIIYDNNYNNTINLPQGILIEGVFFYKYDLPIRYKDIADPPPKFINC
jgi:hypothetical protein